MSVQQREPDERSPGRGMSRVVCLRPCAPWGVGAAHTAALRAKIMVSLHDVTIGAMAAQDGLVWCGTQTGPLLLFDATTRALRRELRAHGGPCIQGWPQLQLSSYSPIS